MNLFSIKKLNRERGSATIEAIISFTGFLFVFFTILNVVNVCRAQALISNAVDTAAKELTQYSYFYEMSGLNKFKDEMDKNAEIGASNLNDVIGTVDSFYTTVGTAYDNTAQHATNIQNAVGSDGIDFESIQKDINSISTDVDSISASIDSMDAAFGSVVDNPLMYLKSIVAVAGSECLDTAVSHVIAAPLSKAFFTKHFGDNSIEASTELERLGVVGGLEGMNFKLSTMFSKEEPDEIHIVVYYKLKINQVFDWACLEVPMCKEAVGHAWLGGDDVISKVIPMPKPEVNEEAPDSDFDDGKTEDTEDTEGTEQTPDGENNDSGSTDLWALPARSDDGYYMVRTPAFMDLMGDTYGFDADANSPFLIGNKGSTGYACMHVTSADDILIGMDQNSLIAENAYYNSIHSLKMSEDSYNPELEGLGVTNCKPGEVKNIVFVVYVPENIPDEVLNDLKAKSENGSEKYKAEAKELLGREVDVNISFVKAGGNYDYGSEG